jgi:hypothetical protein
VSERYLDHTPERPLQLQLRTKLQLGRQLLRRRCLEERDCGPQLYRQQQQRDVELHKLRENFHQIRQAVLQSLILHVEPDHGVHCGKSAGN